jgi:two-component sensor histidine kinase
MVKLSHHLSVAEPVHGRAGGPRRSFPLRWMSRWALVLRCAVCLLCGGAGLSALAEIVDQNAFVAEPSVEEGQHLLDPEWGVGAWIWAAETRDKQTCRFWRTFKIPRGATVAKARIHICVDNGYRLMLNGRELGAGSDWRSITEYDVSLLLGPGTHVLAVNAFNDNREAGMSFGMYIELTDGRVIELASDTEWRIAPANESGWERKRNASADWAEAVVVSKFLPRQGHWHERTPTMTVKVPALHPLEVHFWQRGWVQAGAWSLVCVTGLLYLRVLAKYTVQSRAQALLHTERARIARDIHDELGARLTELALEGEVAQMELPTDSAVRPKLVALCEKARAVSTAMDEVVWMVNSRRDTLRDFANFACRHAQRFLSQSPIRCRLDVGELPEASFDLPVRRSLLLGVKEALNNAVKYSQAAEVSLRIHRRGQSLLVIIEDNGVGFDLESVDSSRNGLTNMRERMKDVGGECRIFSEPGGGCRVEFQVPLPKLHRRPLASGPGKDPTLAAIRGVPPPPAALKSSRDTAL